jgi:hypothetical protein
MVVILPYSVLINGMVVSVSLFMVVTPLGFDKFIGLDDRGHILHTISPDKVMGVIHDDLPFIGEILIKG